MPSPSMERYTCKICSKSFSNGKAVGGHMRTHLAFLPVPPKPQGPQKSVDSIKVNPSKPLCPIKGEEEESINASIPKATRKRSRRCKSIDALGDLHGKLKTTGLVSITSPIEDVALSIMMLSNGKWKDGKGEEEKGKRKVGENKIINETESKERNNDNNDYSGNAGGNYTINPATTQTQSQTQTLAQVDAREVYRCDTCSKGYRSFQILENHRAKHTEIEAGAYECKTCSKVLKSVQGLGRHKKIHASISSASANFRCNLIDLNLPPPEEDAEIN